MKVTGKITSKEPKVEKQKTGQLLDTKHDMQESKLILLILALFLSVPLKKTRYQESNDY